ncbi:MAG: glycosyltransferase family 2 protein [Fibrobacter sp.]|nr:glycosyltransferase family 2 protein [Fibrobacter sp.]
MTHLVSIIVPIYKVEPYLRRCLDSIVNQTYTNLEIILVDDGSPDDCPQICDEYAARDKRIVVIHKENGGLSDARNAGLDICKGEYISFVDSDDWVENEYILCLVENALSTNSDITIVNHDLVWDNHQLKSEPFESCIIDDKKAFRKIILSQTIHLGISCGKLYKKRLFKDIRFPKGKIHEDDFTSYKLIYEANRICCIDRVLYHYYQRQDSITKTDHLYNYIDVVHEQLYFLLEKKELELAVLISIKLSWHWINKYTSDLNNDEYFSKALTYFSTLKSLPRFHIIQRTKLTLAIRFPKLYAIYAKRLIKARSQ